MNIRRMTHFRSIGRAMLWAALSFTLFSAVPGRADLVVHLKLNEGKGVNTENAATGGDDGMLTGAGSVWTSSTPAGFAFRSAYHNNGEDDAFIALPNTSVGLLRDFTITGWINVLNVSGAGGANDRILSKRNLASKASFIDFGFYNVAGGGIGIGLDVQVAGGPLDPKVVSRAIDFSDGWLFVAATRKSDTGEITFFIGRPGKQGVEQIGSGTDTAGELEENAALLMVGNVQANTARNGEVMFSDFRIFDTALSAEELESIRLQASPK